VMESIINYMAFSWSVAPRFVGKRKLLWTFSEF